MKDRDPRAFWEGRYRLLPPGLEPPTPFGSTVVQHLQQLRTRLGRPPVVLEPGAGTGRDARAFAAAGARVVALDVAEAGLARLAGLEGVSCVVADLRAPLPFAAGSFDLVYSHLVLSCDFTEEEVAAALSDMARVVRTDGELWLCVRSIEDPTCRMMPVAGPGHRRLGEAGLHFFSRKQMRRLLAGWTLTVLESKCYEIDGESYGVLCITALRMASETCGSG